MTGKVVQPIKTMEFCVTSSRKGLRDSGLDLGQTVLVIGTKVLPEKRSDPYLQRVYFIVAKWNGTELEIPNTDTGEEDNGYRTYLVDPRCLTKVSPEEQLDLISLLNDRKKNAKDLLGGN